MQLAMIAAFLLMPSTVWNFGAGDGGLGICGLVRNGTRCHVQITSAKK